MKISSATLFLIPGLCLLHEAACQAGLNLPPCATPCVNQLLSSHKCPSSDIKCICANKTLISNASCCIFKHCNPADQKKASNAADSLCSSAGVTNLPKQASCPTTSTPSSHSQTPATHSSKNDGAKATGFSGVAALCAMGGAALAVAGV